MGNPLQTRTHSGIDSQSSFKPPVGPLPLPQPDESLDSPSVGPSIGSEFAKKKPGILPAPVAPTPQGPGDSVSGQLNEVLSSGSPLLTQARTSAAKQSNRRGLLNSSLAVQAGEEAVLNVALPIASQQAAQASTEGLASRQIESTEGLASRQIESEEGLAGRQIESTETLAGNQIEATAALASAQIESGERITAAGIESNERIAASNISSFDKQNATGAIAQFDKAYQELVASIISNPDLPAETREALLVHAGIIRDVNFNLVEQMYNIDLEWESVTV